MTYSAAIIDRFWAKTTTDHELWFNDSKCVIWTGAQVDRTRNTRYGRFCSVHPEEGRRWWVASQFAYVITHGSLPEGWEVDHLCRRSLCVNPHHLEAVTPCENRRRAERHRVYQLTCSRGHLWTYDNWQQRRDGKDRQCAQCNRENAANQRTIPRRTLADLSPACRRNHPRTRKNTRFDKRGVAVCRDCQRERKQEWLARQAGCCSASAAATLSA